MRNQYKVLAEKYKQIKEDSYLNYDPDLVALLKLNQIKKYGVPDLPSHFKKHTNGGGYVGVWAYVPPEVEVPKGTIVVGTSPAFKHAQVWVSGGKFHRVGGPAQTDIDGSKHYYQNGYVKRLDGPAHEWKNGTKEFYINGRKYNEKDYWDKIGASDVD